MIIQTSAEAFQILKSKFNPDAEEVWALFLDSQLNLLGNDLIHRGTANYCQLHCRDLFRQAIRTNSVFIIVAHNHPSKSIEPSLEDIKLTKKIVKVGKFLELPVIDHIIFTSSMYYSFKDSNFFQSR